MTWANASFIAIVFAVSCGVWWLDPTLRERRAQGRRERVSDRLHAKARDDARQLDHDALYRHYRTQMRLMMAGHDPNLAGPVRLPSQDRPFDHGRA